MPHRQRRHRERRGDPARAVQAYGLLAGSPLELTARTSAARLMMREGATADALRLPYAGESFDAVVSGFLLRNVSDLPAALAEMLRVLRPGGKLLLCLPNIAHWRCRLWILAGRFPYVRNTPTDATHLRFFTVHEGRRLCLDRGVEVLAVDGSASLWVRGFYPWPLRRRPLSALYTRLARVYPSLFARDFILVGRKKPTPEREPR